MTVLNLISFAAMKHEKLPNKPFFLFEMCNMVCINFLIFDLIFLYFDCSSMCGVITRNVYDEDLKQKLKFDKHNIVIFILAPNIILLDFLPLL